ncbi:MAG: DsbA family oxidoreductase [Saprospiraceae bacterium]|nr:DsbA family oxidoreductase [Saprospiraceae bacterium]
MMLLLKNKLRLAVLCCALIPAFGAAQQLAADVPKLNSTQPMTVEIWSDVACPFCYIAKRKFEAALEQFSAKDSVQVIWRSFQLNSDLKTDTSITAAQSLGEHKGWSPAQVEDAMRRTANMAASVGLKYHFDRVVVANTFDAHRFAHLAADQGKQIEAEERLFAAYFTEGKNIANHQVLAEIGASMGMDAAAIKAALATDAKADAVLEDISVAQYFRIQSVPCFVFNRKFLVSGARDTDIFFKALEKMKADLHVEGH